MRRSPWKIFLISAFLVNFIIGIIMWNQLDSTCDCSNEQKHVSYIRAISEKHAEESNSVNDTDEHLYSKIVFVIREFEYFDNDITETIKSIHDVIPGAKILIISDKIPYPPLTFQGNSKNVHIVNLKGSILTPIGLQQPLNSIDKEHIFIFPDSVRLHNISQVRKMLQLHYKKPKNIIAGRIEGETSICLNLNISLRYWTIKYRHRSERVECNALEGDHVLLVTKSLLLQLGYPFARPLQVSLFIQSTLLRIKTEVIQELSFKKGRNLFTDPHKKWKQSVLEKERKSKLYGDFGIKKIIYPASKVEWHGCTKNTARCFGTVLNDMPEYLFEGRWTPPCCLENLRQTARYVFSILNKCEVRYWLEGGSLLGAVRTGDIIPWDYDVDIGIYQDDIKKCEWLKNSLEQSIIDTQGFVWEKAREGDFIRVQFSEANHLHVDIFPFYSRNGTMTKNTWFPTHKQDMEFPEHYLKPLYKIKFVGVITTAPNNYREFLELKFGKGVIENPEYPDPKKMRFSKKAAQSFA
ncbi:ribitol 5-phosphate transferase FKRP-like [Uloborus diversus]|uniref:ribitol 5-phosphate transferase FKRP-like n=1 Tax=Uloborus diversus TaxID=327109 RepID=UPI0024090291|nr:ribitol 5-phosphate transferase FKRP-like [Uloborus diversus]